MNVDAMLETLNRQKVDYLLIGGVNFFLRHDPVLTFDVDVWIDDTAENRARCVNALIDLEATWGETEATWGPIRPSGGDWLSHRSVICLLTREGPLDVFRKVRGLPSWAECAGRARAEQTTKGVPYRGLSDPDMLACQLALDDAEQKVDRIRRLKRALEVNAHDAQ